MSYNKTSYRLMLCNRKKNRLKYINNTKCRRLIPIHSSTCNKMTGTNHVKSIWTIADINFLDFIWFFFHWGGGQLIAAERWKIIHIPQQFFNSCPCNLRRDLSVILQMCPQYTQSHQSFDSIWNFLKPWSQM